MIMIRELSDDEIATIAEPFWHKDECGDWTFNVSAYTVALFEAARIQQTVRE